MVSFNDVKDIRGVLGSFSRDELEAFAVGAYLVGCTLIGRLDASENASLSISLVGIMPADQFCSDCSIASIKFHREIQALKLSRN